MAKWACLQNLDAELSVHAKLFQEHKRVRKLSQKVWIVKREGREYLLTVLNDEKAQRSVRKILCHLLGAPFFPYLVSQGLCAVPGDPNRLKPFFMTTVIQNAVELGSADVINWSWTWKLGVLFTVLCQLHVAKHRVGSKCEFHSIEPKHILLSRKPSCKTIRVGSALFDLDCPDVQLIHYRHVECEGNEIEAKSASFGKGTLELLVKYLGYEGAFMVGNAVRNYASDDMRSVNALVVLFAIMQTWKDTGEKTELVPLDVVADVVASYEKGVFCADLQSCLPVFDDLRSDGGSSCAGPVWEIPTKKRNDDPRSMDLPVQKPSAYHDLLSGFMQRSFAVLGYVLDNFTITTVLGSLLRDIDARFARAYDRHALPRNVGLVIRAPLRHGSYEMPGCCPKNTVRVDGGGEARLFVDGHARSVRCEFEGVRSAKMELETKALGPQFAKTVRDAKVRGTVDISFRSQEIQLGAENDESWKVKFRVKVACAPQEVSEKLSRLATHYLKGTRVEKDGSILPRLYGLFPSATNLWKLLIDAKAMPMSLGSMRMMGRFRGTMVETREVPSSTVSLLFNRVLPTTSDLVALNVALTGRPQ